MSGETGSAANACFFGQRNAKGALWGVPFSACIKATGIGEMSVILATEEARMECRATPIQVLPIRSVRSISRRERETCEGNRSPRRKSGGLALAYAGTGLAGLIPIKASRVPKS